MSEWGIELVDLPAYLARIGDRGSLPVTTEVFRRLHRAHSGSIPFESLDVLLGKEVSVDLGEVQDKLVRQRRGGYCGEQNLLFAAVLARIGFTVTRTSARIRMGTDKVNPPTHTITLVEVAGTKWLADVGFGGEGLIEPIALRATEPVVQDGWRYRVVHDGEHGWRLQSMHPEGWFDLYSFTEVGQRQVDLAMSNYFVSTSPRSPFHNRLTAQRAGATRTVLMDDELTALRADGHAERRKVPPDELATVLNDRFDITLDEGDHRRLAAWMSSR